MKLRQNLATRICSVKKRQQPSGDNEFVVWTISPNDPSWIMASCNFKADAHAIAALPKFYALALEVMKLPKGYPNIEQIVELAREALDAANIADEPK